MADSPTTPDIGTIVWRFRDDVVIVPQTIAGEPIYVIEDPVTGKCYRMGKWEYAIASLLDGKCDLKEVLQKLRRSHAEHSSEHVSAVLRWLLQSGLVVQVGSPAASSASTALAQTEVSKSDSLRFNPLFFRVPMIAPDRILERLRPWMGWLFSPPAMIAFAVLGIIAGTQLLTDWNRLIEFAGRELSVGRGCTLLICGVGLKLLHELGHGLACKRHSCYVREAGIALFLFTPLPYVDVTSSWRLRSKWARIQIAAAGMYVEASVAIVAAFTWSCTVNEAIARLASDVIVLATATTILFNTNPFMRFDGYYILSDMLEAPNLYPRGQLFVRWLTRRVLLGDKTAFSGVSPLEAAYGLIAAGWRTIVCLSLICGAARLFHGAGIILAIAAIFAWLIKPLFNFALEVRRTGSRRAVLRLTTMTVGAALVVAVLGTHLRWPFPRRAPGIVEYKPLHVVRAASAGFVDQMLVYAGTYVRSGEVLVKLRNDELLDELKLAELSVEESKIRCRLYRQRGEMAKHQAELEQLATYQSQRDQKAKQVQALTISASADGMIIGRNLSSLLGTYLEEGQEICRIGQEQAKEVQLSIHQDDVQAYQTSLGSPVSIRSANGSLAAALSDISPRATDQASILSLCVPHGGPLPVRAERDAASRQALKLLDARFTGHIELTPETSRHLRAGQLCTVMVHSHEDSIAAVLTSQLREWVGHKLQSD